MKIDINSSYETFDSYLSDIAPKIKPYLLDSIKNARDSFDSISHKDLETYLYKPLSDFNSNAGKLHRPATCIASYLALGGDINNLDCVIPVAVAIELFQSFALIHDDIADKAELRRGKPCMYKQEGEGIAINAGDFGLAMVVASVVRELEKLNVDKDKILKIVDELSRMEYMTIEGQALDLG